MATTLSIETATRASGTVKLFDFDLGYGFVLPDAGDGDAFITRSILKEFACHTFPDGARIVFNMIVSSRGRRVTKIIDLDVTSVTRPVQDATCSRYLGRSDQSHLIDNSGPFEPVVVKWFDQIRGFGFLIGLDNSREIFVHSAVIQRAGIADITSGQRYRARVAEGEKGFWAVMVEAEADAPEIGAILGNDYPQFRELDATFR